MNKLVFIFAVCLFFLSCKDDPEPDVRAQAVGNYSFTGKYYYIYNSNLVPLGSDFNNHGTFSLTVDPLDQTGILITDLSDQTQVFHCSKIKTSAEGFSFEVASQELGNSNPAFIIEGYKGAALQSGNLSPRYHGVFLRATNELIFYWQFTDDNSGFHFVSGYEAVKK